MSIDRRTFFKLSGAGVLGVVFTPLLSGCEEHTVIPIGPSPLGAEIPFITPTDEFFIQNGGEGDIVGWTMPTLTRESWTLQLAGEFATPMTIRFQDLLDLRDANQEVTVLKTMQCILESTLRITPTGYSGNALWTGVPLRPLLDRAGLFYDSTRRLIFTGADGFQNNITIDRLTTGVENGQLEPLLVYQMNGSDLTPEHGAPVRLLIQEGYGYKNIKWLTRINASLSNAPVGNYQRNGFVDDGIIRVTSRSTNVTDRLSLPAGVIEISGYAVSGFEGIERVEISFDGGATWNPVGFQSLAEMRDELRGRGSGVEQIDRPVDFRYPYTGVWVKWRYRWENALRGNYEVAIRAIDAAGNSQPLTDPTISDGQTAVARYRVTLT